MKILKIIPVIFALLLFSCSTNSGDENSNPNLLQNASGAAGDMIIIMDSTLYDDSLGQAIKEVFKSEMKGLPREELYFDLNQVEPQEANSVLRKIKNLVFVMTLDNTSRGNMHVKEYFSEASLQQIKEQPELFMYTAEDVYSKGQLVLYLFSTTEEKLTEQLLANKEKIRDVFNNKERERLEEKLFKSTTENISEALAKKHQFSMKIPFGYETAENSEGFVWFRQMNDDSDKNIFITYKPYEQETQFEKQEIIALRDSIARVKLYEDPEIPNTYIITETGVPFKPVITREVNFNGNYAVEMRGLWRTKTASMGGPFLSYTFVDEKLGRLYYIEGFLFSPGEPQREFMRELEVILHTFEPRS